ncbi:MAG TPA: hypothetical protein VD887_02555 [Allosphingosinicella sp.]|nr:hypothetical protein [Allosphingosinicella sp.]
MSHTSRFARFAAVDWSGAKGRRHKGIAIGLCETGGAPPRLVAPLSVAWSRTEVMEWVLATAREAPTLFGFDFSYAPPIVERGAYFPGDEGVPEDARAFWDYVDRLCESDEDLGAASLVDSRHRRHFYLGAADGVKRDFLHHRVCEHSFNALGGGKASTLYDAIGAAQVAKASYSGMRLLNRLNRRLPVWPMDPLPAEGSAIVEIYTRVFILMAGLSGRKVRTLSLLNQALDALGSAPAALPREPNDHETDVLIAAAGLRRIAGDPSYWNPAALTPAVARGEGWTFGVR